jgi:hypothetical protein
MIGGFVWSIGDRLPDHRCREVLISPLMLDHPQQMQTVWIASVNCQNLPVDSLRLGQSSGLVVPKSVLDHDA